MKSTILFIILISLCIFANAASADPGKQFLPSDYTVFIDKQTGFAFVRTPYGWKFVRKIESPQLAEQAAALQLAFNDKR